MKRSNTALAAIFVTASLMGVAAIQADAEQVGPEAFEDPIRFDFAELASGTHLGPGYANPYLHLGVEFMGYVANCTYEGIQGNHLASGFANTSSEPFIVRVRLLGEPALRVGAYVWPEYGSSTSITAFDDYGSIIETYSVRLSTGAPFMGLESSLDRPIRYVEWRGLAGSTLTTFPRVDGVRIDVVPEPATLSLLGIGGAVALLRRRAKARFRCQPLFPLVA